DQAARPHVHPVLVDVVQAFLPGRRAVRDLPAGGHLDELGPQRVLALVVDQCEVGAVLVLERVGAHGFPPVKVCCGSARGSSAAAMTGPISSSAAGLASCPCPQWTSCNRICPVR